MRIVDRTVEDSGRGQAIDAQCRNDGVRLPVAVRGIIAAPQAPRAAAITAQQISRDARFIDEDVAPRIMQRQHVLPSPAQGGDVSAPLFVGEYRFFNAEAQPIDLAPERAEADGNLERVSN